MVETPLVSAIMVSRNNGSVIGAAVDTVFSQTYSNFELIVVENASQDDSWETIRKKARSDLRLKPIKVASEVTIPQARNLALQHVTGDYVATIDADDLWHADRLAVQLDVMEREEASKV